jgi:hypothetical protein
MRYAILQNNTCENIIECLKKDIEILKLNIGKNIVLIPIEYGIGDVYINESWIKKDVGFSKLDKLIADVDYLAIMTGVDL